MFHRLARTMTRLAAAALLLSLTPSLSHAQSALPIADALEKLEISTYFTVVGTIVDSEGQYLFWIEDDSGRMPVFIKDHLVRKHGALNRDDRVQISGRFEHKKLDSNVRGMMVSKLHRLPSADGATGANNPGASATSDVVVPSRAPAPAAPGTQEVMRPMASDEFKRRVRAAMQDYRKAEADAVDAGQIYARSAREAGSDGQVDAAVLEELQQAEARVVEARGRIPAILSEAREAGVDEGIIEMIQMETRTR